MSENSSGANKSSEFCITEILVVLGLLGILVTMLLGLERARTTAQNIRTARILETVQPGDMLETDDKKIVIFTNTKIYDIRRLHGAQATLEDFEVADCQETYEKGLPLPAKQMNRIIPAGSQEYAEKMTPALRWVVEMVKFSLYYDPLNLNIDNPAIEKRQKELWAVTPPTE